MVEAHLKSCLDQVNGSNKRSCRSSSNGSCHEYGQRTVVTGVIRQQGLDVGVGRKVDGAEGDIPQNASRGSLVNAGQPQPSEHTPSSLIIQGGEGPGHLEPDLDDLQRVGEDHVDQTRHGPRQHLPTHRDVAMVGLCQLVADKVIGGQLDSLLWSNITQIQSQASIQTSHTLQES